MRSELYQLFLILLLVVSVALFGVFFSRELFPQYKVFQQDYIALEEFRSTITHDPVARFDIGIKQIVLPQEHNGPEIVDRCTSCHVALQLTHFSPTKIARNVNGEVILDKDGYPVQVANENYVWKQLDDRIAALTDESALEALRQQGDSSQVRERLAEAEHLKSLKTVTIGGLQVDVSKALMMHPLIGKETRPFEFHPIEEYGCTVCHNGNGRALTIEKAHGPVYDDQYPEAFEGPVPQFLENDPNNDPTFSKVFNHKPSHELLFQTTPLFVGELIQANCVQCHLSSSSQLKTVVTTVGELKGQTAQQAKDVQRAYLDERKALLALLTLRKDVVKDGLEETVKKLKAKQTDYSLSPEERNAAEAQLIYLTNTAVTISSRDPTGQQQAAVEQIQKDIIAAVGAEDLATTLEKKLADGKQTPDEILDAFVQSQPDSKGHLFAKAAAADRQQIFLQHIGKAESTLSSSLGQEQVKQAVASDIDRMIKCYQRGEQLYISQACYACHRIAGFARGGVGPELTFEGIKYPWFVKESIVWPQADLPTSTMPNYHLDHEELEALTCYLLGQKGRPNAVSQVDYNIAVKQWEEGKKQPWEEPVPPSKIHDLHFGMTVFATEGCSACHRLKGFESNIGFALQKGHTPTFDELYREQIWFSDLFPEEALGSQIVKAIDDHGPEIDKRIMDGVRQDAILEEIERKHPDLIEALYSNFRFAARAKDYLYHQKAAQEKTAEGKQAALDELAQWKARVQKVLKMYIQEYGLGRQVGPRPNWSGIYRSDEWLMEHFYNPVTHVARSIMPVFPFDETKFYALTYMLDTLAPHNAEAVREIWDNRGFNPELAFHIHCALCHGDFRQGDGPIAQWLYPIPKNLRNANFLHNLTKERVAESITHGVKGTPMPPWGEVAKDKPFANKIPVLNAQEIQRLTDWLFMSLPNDDGESSEPLKWKYQPEDVLRELHQEGDALHSGLPRAEGLVASLKPVAVHGQPEQKIDDIFDVKPYPIAGVDRKAYYIKEKFYTPQNLAAGERTFIDNCAICHGKEGAGNGLRAGAMTEAKPRMLTNLDWIATRDDLRLLQSIKFGVLGTAMTPWGDFTSTLQRLQLVMFIRSLSREHAMREHLSELLYQSFDRPIETIRQAQILEYGKLQKLEDGYQAAQDHKAEQEAKLAIDKAAVESLVKAYQDELAIGEKVKKQRAVDDAMQQLIIEVKKQREIYNLLGTTALASLGEGEVADGIIDLVGLNAIHYDYKDDKLIIDDHSSDPAAIKAHSKKVLDALSEQVADLEKEQKRLEGQIGSSETRERLTDLQQRIKMLNQAQVLLLTSMEESARSRIQQEQLVNRINRLIEATKESHSSSPHSKALRARTLRNFGQNKSLHMDA